MKKSNTAIYYIRETKVVSMYKNGIFYDSWIADVSDDAALRSGWIIQPKK